MGIIIHILLGCDNLLTVNIFGCPICIKQKRKRKHVSQTYFLSNYIFINKSPLRKLKV